MPKAVLTTKVDPSYDDLPEHRYHFPRTYLRAAQAALDDWIVYYEPRRASADLSSRGGRQSYFATARIVHIGRDPNRDDHYYAVRGGLSRVRPCGALPRGKLLLRERAAEGGRLNKQGQVRPVGAASGGRRIQPDSRCGIRGRGRQAEATRHPRRRAPRHGSGAGGPADRRVGFAQTLPRPRVRHGHQEGLRQHLRDEQSQDHQRRREGRGPGRAHPAREGQRAGQPSERRWP